MSSYYVLLWLSGTALINQAAAGRMLSMAGSVLRRMV